MFNMQENVLIENLKEIFGEKSFVSGKYERISCTSWRPIPLIFTGTTSGSKVMAWPQMAKLTGMWSVIGISSRSERQRINKGIAMAFIEKRLQRPLNLAMKHLAVLKADTLVKELIIKYGCVILRGILLLTSILPHPTWWNPIQINAGLKKREEIETFWFANFTSTSNPGAPISILMMVELFIFVLNIAVRSLPLLSQMSRSQRVMSGRKESKPGHWVLFDSKNVEVGL